MLKNDFLMSQKKIKIKIKKYRMDPRPRYTKHFPIHYGGKGEIMNCPLRGWPSNL